MPHTSDIRVLGYEPLLAPAALLADLPLGAGEAGLVEVGDRVVITAGTAVNIPGSTNVIKVDVAASKAPSGYGRVRASPSSMLTQGRSPITSRATAFIGALGSRPGTAPLAPTASATTCSHLPCSGADGVVSSQPCAAV